MTDLRSIDRLDEDVINRVVAAIAPVVQESSRLQWVIGDALLAEWPIQSASEACGLNGELRRYFEAVGRRVGLRPETLRHYRFMSGRYKPCERIPDRSYSCHHLVVSLPDRDGLLRSGKSYTELAAAAGKRTPAQQRSWNRRDRSFSNISKAAEAAVEILSDADVPADRRVALALCVLVKFFEDAAAA